MTLLEFFSSFDDYETAVTRNGEILFKSSEPFDVNQKLDIVIPDNYINLLDVNNATVCGDGEQLALLVTMYGVPVIMGLMYQTKELYEQKISSLISEFANEEHHGQ